MPEEAWEALEVERLRRAIDDDSYRDDILRAKGIVSALSLIPPACRGWLLTGTRGWENIVKGARAADFCLFYQQRCCSCQQGRREGC